jgi:hypothetical protein
LLAYENVFYITLYGNATTLELNSYGKRRYPLPQEGLSKGIERPLRKPWFYEMQPFLGLAQRNFELLMV